ncbi:MAG: HNH endonuclease [SAR324 cluster bacterium]|nr:HNH endonuclease [SAR324 cluster bacterium]
MEKMKLFSMKKSSKLLGLQRSFTDNGIEYLTEIDSFSPSEWWFTEPERFQNDYQDTIRYLAQLEEEELAKFQGNKLLITWDDVYRILGDETHLSSVRLLQLPEICQLVPCLSSSGGLSDANFQIQLTWRTSSGKVIHEIQLTGAIIRSSNNSQPFLLSASAWSLVKSVHKFDLLLPSEKTTFAHQQEWGRIRKRALACGAMLDDFLEKTIVLSPETLHLAMNPVFVANTQVVEIQPTFEDAPEKWLNSFDHYDHVQNRYSIPTSSGGIIHIVIAPEVKTVLSEIKRMPGRRVSGRRAQAFIRNPYALLGEDAEKVVPPDIFEQDRQTAQFEFYRFHHQVRYSDETIVAVEIVIESTSSEFTPAESFLLESPLRLNQFVEELESKLDKKMLCCFWEGYELELDSFAESQLLTLKDILEQWKTISGEIVQGSDKILIDEDVTSLNGVPVIDAETAFNLVNYSERVDGIGARQTISSPFISKSSGESEWIPTTVPVVIKWQSSEQEEPYYLQCVDEDLGALEQQISVAQQKGETELVFPKMPMPISMQDAITLTEQLRDALFPSTHEGTSQQENEAPVKQKKDKLVLQIKQNIAEREYEEQRAMMLEFNPDIAPLLPSSLESGVELKAHQKIGVAWLQNLWSKSPEWVRGCILADDMGLGKTLQLLTFIARFFEDQHQHDPVLVVAPVALLDNWENEIHRFFKPGFACVLKLYGDSLKALKLPLSQIDDSLLEKGLTKFLKPDWYQNKDIILTTYETLRDHEFSFATVSWSIMVCDEAQKIKTPGAMVTQGVKKQKARFKIACTGTPVENSLTDLWCLFDFIQPLFLGSLNEFGSRYTRPIESQTEEQQNKLEELRIMIEPQILRRMKTEVAKDLPQKHDNPDSQGTRLPLSTKQQQLYQKVKQEYYHRTAFLKENSPKTGNPLLGYIHQLRMICAHPVEERDNVKLNEVLKHSPKLSWLLQQLKHIETQKEKVIIFTDYKELQRMIQKAIHEKFGFSPVIINGETPVSSKGRSRQTQIDEFQKKTGFGVVILGTSAMGFGVNIQAANHVIHFTRPWNPAKEDQATDRAYRIGQTRPVFVYTPTVVSGDFQTFEAKLAHLLEKKRKLAQDMLNGCDSIQSEDFMECLLDETIRQENQDHDYSDTAVHISQIENPPKAWVDKERGKLTQKLRYQILKRDASKCQVCGKNATTDNAVLEIDHIIPVSKWGRTEPGNLRVVCRECNRGKGSDH